MKKFNKISAVVWFILSGLAILMSIIKWSFVCFALGFIFFAIGRISWDEYQEIKKNEEIYKRFKK